MLSLTAWLVILDRAAAVMAQAADLTPYLSSGVVIAALTAGGVWLSSRNSRRAAERAVVAVQEVDQRKVDQETFDRVVREWKGLAEAATQRANAANDLAVAQGKQMADLLVRAEQADRDRDQLHKLLAAHEVWDHEVIVLVRQIDPGFRDPPPLT